MREIILDLLNGKKLNTQPVFSGLIHITAEGLTSEGLALHEVHHDAGKMASVAASTFKLTGMPSAALPWDLCAPAEALGAMLNFYEGEVNKSIQLLVQTGADAISVDQLTDLKAAREVLKDTLLFGNIDPVATLWEGTRLKSLRQFKRRRRRAWTPFGVDATWSHPRPS